jgi:hypothetical protein
MFESMCDVYFGNQTNAGKTQNAFILNVTFGTF